MATGLASATTPRCALSSMMQLTEEQVLSFLRRIECPTLLIRPRQGWPADQEQVQARADSLETLEVVGVEGGHHVHLDHPERCLPSLQAFLERLG